jgi:uncharacterized membrane protein (UPF0127 family)
MDATTAAFSEANPLDYTTIQVGARRMEVHVARTPEQWAQGLVGHSDIDAMLFVLPGGSRFPFHMTNVDRDIVIAFFNGDGKMVDYAFLQAQVGIKWPAAAYTYVLELAEPVDPAIFDDLDHGLTIPGTW